MPNHVIRIHNASFYAYHGAASDEQTLGGKFEVDVELRGDFTVAMTSDDLKQAIDYERVYARVNTIVTAKKHFLLESLARTLTRELLAAFPLADSVLVRVRKPHPPVKGVVDFVEIELFEERH